MKEAILKVLDTHGFTEKRAKMLDVDDFLKYVCFQQQSSEIGPMTLVLYAPHRLLAVFNEANIHFQ